MIQCQMPGVKCLTQRELELSQFLTDREAAPLTRPIHFQRNRICFNQIDKSISLQVHAPHPGRPAHHRDPHLPRCVCLLKQLSQ